MGSSKTKSGTEGRTERFLTPGRLGVAAIGILGLVFIFENTGSTRIRLLIPQVTMPLWMALLLTALIGALCGAFFMRRRK
ncbi:lipopolysaccharide assembly protein LapA domain-containing protein [Streptomyces sp. KLOTTS4A1]|uniref:lipopolysaccharide assembly protein LapA domain-containing protein n=1 Tax=Streptomyces sp. KLOTTS4A1 TaxID=3390996 RepID=UPI0039F55C49